MSSLTIAKSLSALLDKLRGDMLKTDHFILTVRMLSSGSMRNVPQNLYSICRRGASCVFVGTNRTNRLSNDGRNRGDFRHGHRSGPEPED